MINRRLLALVPSARVFLVLAIVCGLGALCAQVEVFFCLATVLEQITEASSLADEWVAPLQHACAWALAAFVLELAARWCRTRASATARAQLSATIFNKLVALGIPYWQRTHTSTLVQLLGEGVQRLCAYVGSYVPQFFLAILAPIVLGILLARTSIPAALLMLVCAYGMPVAIMRFMSRAKAHAGEQWGSYTNLGAMFFDAISGLTTLKVYGAEKAKQAELAEQAEFFRTTTMRLLRIQLNSITYMDIFTYGGMALGCAAALMQMHMGQLGSAEVFAVVLASPLFFLPMRNFGTMFHVGTNGEDVASQLFKLLDEDEPAKGTASVKTQHPEISCENLHFGYGQDHEVLQGINLNIPAHAIIGITGASGSGKSTLVNVLAGMASPYTGSVRLGGEELASITPASLHETVTLVSKQSHLFKGTVRSNLLMANPQATDPQLWDALRRAHIAEEVYAAGGLDLAVEEGGRNFSGGQRQRLNFARAILHDTPIYIFDEAASNVDAESEQLLFNIMQEIAFTKLVIVVTHRLHSLRWTDEIVVMENGRIAQVGAHATLLAQEGPYKQLWQRNAALEEFAARVASPDDAPPVAAPTPREEFLATLPGMAQTAMRAVFDAKDLQKYTEGESSSASGHPAWIPLPANYKDIGNTQEQAEEGQVGLEDISAEISAPTSAQPPARSLHEIIAGLSKLTEAMQSDLREALFLGFASNLAVVAMLGFAVVGLLALVDAVAPIGFPLALVGMVLCAFARGPLHYGERLYTHDQTFKTLALIRAKVFEALARLAPAKLESRSSGDVIALVTSDIEQLEGFYSRTITPSIAAFACALAIVLLALVLAPALGLVLLACFAVCGVLLPLGAARISRNREAHIHEFALAMQSFLFDSLRGFGDLVQFGRASEYASELEAHLETLESGQVNTGFKEALLESGMQTVSMFANIALVLCAWMLVSQHLAGAFPAALCVVLGIAGMQILEQVAHVGSTLSHTRAAANRILDLFSETPQVSEVQQGTQVEQFTGAEARQVHFSYNGVHTVLENVNLEIEAGRAVRIVGESGIGKTTLLRLFMRFWDAQRGSIHISGEDIRTITSKSLHATQAYMTQDTYIFNASLRDNIQLAKLDATEEELLQAVEAAALADSVARLPQGLDTKLGSSVVQLSEGERQRIGLARAFLHDAPFIILDEPTSNLDALNEAAILYSLAAHTQGKTILVASHRPTMVAIADTTVYLS